MNYYQEKENEQVYKGNIVFTINEYGHSGMQLQAFLPKSTTKMVLDLIKTHHFHYIFPNGFKQYGGTARTKRARVFSIYFDAGSGRYIFQIEEGQGQLIKNGAIKMIQKEKSVMSYVSLYDTLELSHEVLDFINQAEFAAMINGKPLYTIMQYQQREKTLIQ